MLKKILVILTALAFVVLLAGAAFLGLTVLRLREDLAAARAEVNSLNGMVGALRSENESLSAGLAEATARADELQAEVEGQAESIEGARVRVELVNQLFVPVISGELREMSDDQAFALFLDWYEKVEDLNDPVLDRKFDQMVRSQSDDDFADFFIYLLESAQDSLE